MLTQKRIGLDFDDVLVNFNKGMAAYHNEIYGTSYTREDITNFDYSKLLGCDRSEALRRMREFVFSSHHDYVEDVEGAVEGVKTLIRSGHSLTVITARDEIIKPQTYKVAEKYFGDGFSDFIFLHSNDVNLHGTKGEVCRRLQVDVMVEDSLENAHHLSEAQIPTLLFDTPWNQTSSLPKYVTRVFGWGHVLSEIN